MARVRWIRLATIAVREFDAHYGYEVILEQPSFVEILIALTTKEALLLGPSSNLELQKKIGPAKSYRTNLDGADSTLFVAHFICGNPFGTANLHHITAQTLALVRRNLELKAQP